MNLEGPNPISLKMLLALNRMQQSGKVRIYDGSVRPEKVRANRAANKRARIARRTNRRK